MLTAIVALQIVVFIAVLVLLVRNRGTADAGTAEDARLTQLLAAQLPEKFTQMDARAAALDAHLRAELSHLRSEVVTTVGALGGSQAEKLDRFRGESKNDAEQLRTAVEAQMGTLAQRLSAFIADSLQHHVQSRDALHVSLQGLGRDQSAAQDKLRTAVEERLNKLNEDNAAKLEQMRLTVDEKLHATLQTRLTESFGAVTEQLSKVHAGLGEMNTLSTGVSDLNRIFSNVKSRGGFAELQLGKLLEQVLAPGQYVENANVRPGTQEVVEYAVRFPGAAGEVLLPIDAKFPREDWERLETAYEQGIPGPIEQARKAFDAAIRVEGKRICSKYINEPVTTPYAIMFLPTEGLYAEVLRRDGLQADLHLNCRVMVAGPANLYALLTSFQLGFRMLNLQKKGNEVWSILAKTQTEFHTFETLMSSMEKQVGTVQNTIQKLGVRTRAINRTLRDVSTEAAGTSPELGTGFDGMLPMLAAADDD